MEENRLVNEKEEEYEMQVKFNQLEPLNKQKSSKKYTQDKRGMYFRNTKS